MTPSVALDLCGSDKVTTTHSYGPFYDGVALRLATNKRIDETCGRTHALTLLEIGVDQGHSIRAWRKAFPDANIYGIDISPKPAGYPDDCYFAQLDATDGGAVAAQLASWGDVQFDLIIDDASHKLNDQIATWNLLYEKVRHGGLYVIEDVEPDSIAALSDAVRGEIHDFRAASGRFDDVIVEIQR